MKLGVFSETFRGISASPIRALLRDSNRPGMISFAGGVPASEGIDHIHLRNAVQKVQDQGFESALAYGETDGMPSLRQALAKLSAERGLPVKEDELLVTSGSQQALDLLVRATVSPGDVVLVEPASYPGALQAFRLAGAVITTVRTDADGIVAAELEDTLRRLGGRAKLIYTVPTFCNPTGCTWSEERREAIASLAAHHEVLLVEDDAYSALRFKGDSIRPIRALASVAEAWTVYISTLSKIVAPGLRIGWMVASSEVLKRCAMAKQVSDMCASTMSQSIAAAYLETDALASNLPRMVDLYRMRAEVMMSSLRDELGDAVSFTQPAGGMFLWLRLHEGIDARSVFERARKENVLFVPGPAFGTETLSSCIRLSFSCTAPDDISEGVSRLRRALFPSSTH